MPEAVATQFQKFFILEKYDPFKGIAIGIATAESVDRDNEELDYDKSKPFFEAWSQSVHKDSGGKSFGNVRLQHDEKKVAGKLDAIHFDDENKIIRVEALAVDPVAKELLETGCLSGFSIGGRYVEKSPRDSRGVVRYVADPYEISLVDRPALPEAVFQSVKADGSVELKKFAKYETTRTENKKDDAASKSVPEESFDAIRAKVQAALDTKYPNTNNGSGACVPSCWVWIKDIFLNSVVYSVNGGGKGDGELFECTYSETGDSITLSEPVEVIATYVPTNKSVRYLVPDGDHLPYTDENGNISHRLMGAAWAALHGGYRGNKYEGADKDKALARLKRLYESEGMETPDASKAMGELLELIKSGDNGASSEQILEVLESLEKTIMADEKDNLTLDKAARHNVHQKIQAAKAMVTSHMAACKAHHDAMHGAMDGIAKVLGGGPESMNEDGKPNEVIHESPKVTPQAPGASAIADKADKFVLVGKDAAGNEIYQKSADPNAPIDRKQLARDVAIAILEVQKASTAEIGDRSKVKPFVKAATKEEDGGGAGDNKTEEMSKDDWKAYSEGKPAAIAKAQRCTANKWQPTPSRIANREAARQGVAR